MTISTRPRGRFRGLVLGMALGVLGPTGVLAQLVPPQVVNGLPTEAYPSVVALVAGGAEDCTGTLIGCETVLTAAHCINGKMEEDIQVGRKKTKK